MKLQREIFPAKWNMAREQKSNIGGVSDSGSFCSPDVPGLNGLSHSGTKPHWKRPAGPAWMMRQCPAGSTRRLGSACGFAYEHPAPHGATQRPYSIGRIIDPHRHIGN
jgi:hypothetical protein